MIPSYRGLAKRHLRLWDSLLLYQMIRGTHNRCLIKRLKHHLTDNKEHDQGEHLKTVIIKIFVKNLLMPT